MLNVTVQEQKNRVASNEMEVENSTITADELRTENVESLGIIEYSEKSASQDEETYVLSTFLNEEYNDTAYQISADSIPRNEVMADDSVISIMTMNTLKRTVTGEDISTESEPVSDSESDSVSKVANLETTVIGENISIEPDFVSNIDMIKTTFTVAEICIESEPEPEPVFNIDMVKWTVAGENISSEPEPISEPEPELVFNIDMIKRTVAGENISSEPAPISETEFEAVSELISNIDIVEKTISGENISSEPEPISEPEPELVFNIDMVKRTVAGENISSEPAPISETEFEAVSELISNIDIVEKTISGENISSEPAPISEPEPELVFNIDMVKRTVAGENISSEPAPICETEFEAVSELISNIDIVEKTISDENISSEPAPISEPEPELVFNIDMVKRTVAGENNENVVPLVVCQDFPDRAELDNQAYILGVAFDDTNNDNLYQKEEGISDMQVVITGIEDPNYHQILTVANVGEYQQLVDPGDYSVEFVRDGVVVKTSTVSIAAADPQDVRVDFGSTIFTLAYQISSNNLPTTEIITDDSIISKTIINTIDSIFTEEYTSTESDSEFNIDMVKRTFIEEKTATELEAESDIEFAPEAAYNSLQPLVLAVVALGDNLQNGTSDSNLIDFTKDFTQASIPDLTGKTITVDFVEVSANASYHNHAGLYRVDDASGKINDLNPGDPGYVMAALRRSKESNQGVELDRNVVAFKTLEGGAIYSMFVVANGTVDGVLSSENLTTMPNVYFNHVKANVDGFNHIKSLGANKFGFEDTFGGGDRDYNDLIFKVDAKVSLISG